MLILLTGKRGIGKLARVDDVDLEKIKNHSWHLNNNGYAMFIKKEKDGKRRYLMHRLILGLSHGDGLQADHINGDKLDNRRENLRIVTNAQNCQNRSNLNKKRNFGAPIRGAHWHASRNRWQAAGTINGKKYFLGYYKTQQEAGDVAKSWRLINMTHSVE